MNRIFRLLGLVALAAYVGARLRRRSSALPHTDDFGLLGRAVAPEALRTAHAQSALLHDMGPRPAKNLL